jgi:hypothetical protein
MQGPSDAFESALKIRIDALFCATKAAMRLAQTNAAQDVE